MPDHNGDPLMVQLVGADRPERDSVRAALARLPWLQLVKAERVEDGVSSADIDALDEAPLTDVVAIIVGADPAAAVNSLRRWSASTPRPLLIAFHSTWPPSLTREILQAGANELVKLPPTAEELDLIFLKLRESRRPHRRRNGIGRVYAVTGLTGGVGLSTVAANLALAFKYTMNRRVAILDLDLQNSSLDLALHLDPTESIASLLDGIERLDSMRLEGALTKHPAGIYVLLAPKRIEQAELVTDTAVAAVLDLMRQLFDVVVVDCGQRVTDNALMAWERCEQVLYVTDQNPWSIRRMARFTRLFTNLGLSDIELRLVLNRYVAGLGPKLSEIAETARMPVFACLPREDHLMAALQLHEEDLWRQARSSRLARAFDNLAVRLDEPATDLAPPRFMTRLLGAIGMRN